MIARIVPTTSPTSGRSGTSPPPEEGAATGVALGTGVGGTGVGVALGTGVGVAVAVATGVAVGAAVGAGSGARPGANVPSDCRSGRPSKPSGTVVQPAGMPGKDANEVVPGANCPPPATPVYARWPSNVKSSVSVGHQSWNSFSSK